jgi:hypothetical protein
MNNSKLTANEINLLAAILRNEFHDGCPPVDNPIWVDCIDGWSDTAKFGGVMASLTKKGLAGTDGESCWISQAGFDAIQ